MEVSKLTQDQIMEAILGTDSEDPFLTFLSSIHDKRDDDAKSMFYLMKQQDPDSLALKLTNSLVAIPTCAKLLRKLLHHDLTTWHNLSSTTQIIVKSTLLDAIKLETSESAIEDLYLTIMHLGVSLLRGNNWPELLPFLCQCLTDNDSTSNLKISVFLIFAKLADKIGEIIAPFVKDLHPVLLNTLKGDAQFEVRMAATTAGINFIQCAPGANEKERFQYVLPWMMMTLVEALTDKEEFAAEEILTHFIELAKNEPRFFRTQLVDVVNTMLETAEDKSLNESTRQLAVEFLVILVEAKEKAPGMMKKVPRFTDRCFAIILDFLQDIKDEPSWQSTENSLLDMVGETHGCILGQGWLGRFSIALGGKTVTPIAIEQLGDYLVSPEWEKRHAALVAFAKIAKGCSKEMIKYLEEVVDMVLHAFQDPYPRVRWAAIYATTLLLYTFRESKTAICPDSLKQYHSQVLPALVTALDDFQNPRVQALAALAFVEFFLSMEQPDIWLPYLDGIVKKLIVLIQKGNQMVQDEALEALGCIASVSKEHFQKYYDFVMQCMKTVMVNANYKSNRMLESRALACICCVGMAVGKEKFRDDLKQVMEVLESLQKSQAKEFNTTSNIIKACHRICNYMGKDFLRYMSTIMPLLVECAQLELDKTVLPDELGHSIHKVKFGDDIICIGGRILLLTKAYACNTLCFFADILEDDFFPWIPQVASILVPLLKFHIHHDVRTTAIFSMYFLLRSAKWAVEEGTAQCGKEEYFKQLADNIILTMGNALYSEPQTKLCPRILFELNRCLQICGPLLNDNQIRSIIDGIKYVITESSHRKGEFTEIAKSEDFDAEEAELLREKIEIEEDVFKAAGDILSTLIKTFKDSFLPFFDELLPYLTGKDKAAAERSQCLFIFDALVDNCGEAALKYYNIFFPLLLDSSNEDHPDCRQNALYGLGLCAEHSGSVLKPFIEEVLSKINVVIMHLRAREPDNDYAFDNAVSALGKIIMFHGESVDLHQIVPAWLNCLPIKVDLAEAKVVHDQLCSMVERSDRHLLGPNYLHLPKIISVFAEVLCGGKDLATEETAKRMINLLRDFQQTVAPDTLASAWLLLLPQQEMELESLLSPEEEEDVNAQ